MNILKKGDIILVIVILVLGCLVYFSMNPLRRIQDNSGKIAVVKQNDRTIRTIDLDKVEKPERIEIEGKYREVILVEKGRIRFESANCPDQVCVSTGWLTRKGDTAICIPNHTIIKIEGQSDEVDGVSY